jgi:predicted aconitase with swiveling domain
VFPQNKGKINDKEHELFGQDLSNKILFVPCSIGSTTGGLFLMEAIKAQIAPKAIVVKKADPLLVSGGILTEIWLENVIVPPIIECPEIFDRIKTGDMVKIEKNEIELVNQ